MQQTNNINQTGLLYQLITVLIPNYQFIFEENGEIHDSLTLKEIKYPET